MIVLDLIMFSRVANAIVRFILILSVLSEETWLANLLPSLNSLPNLILLFYCPSPYFLNTCSDGESEKLLNAFMGVLLTKAPYINNQYFGRNRSSIQERFL